MEQEETKLPADNGDVCLFIVMFAVFTLMVFYYNNYKTSMVLITIMYG